MSEPKKRANSQYVHSVTPEGVLVWVWPQGRLTIDPKRLSAPAREFLLTYGIRQWATDGAAVSADRVTGKVDPLEKFEGMRERTELANSGAEDLTRRAPRGPKPLDAILLAAVAEVTGKPIGADSEETGSVRAMVAAGAIAHGVTGHVYLAKLATNTQVAAAADRLRAAAAPADIDADAELERMRGQ